MTNNQQVATQQIGTLRTLLEKQKEQFAKALPQHIQVEKFLRVCMTAIQRNPRLLECTPLSVIKALMESAQLGLIPDGPTGQAYLVPYKNKGIYEAQFQIGWRGYVVLARNSGDVSNIMVQAVYDNDDFGIDFSTPEMFWHRPKIKGERGEPYLYWAKAQFKDGSFYWDYMSVDDINKRRDFSQGYKAALKDKADAATNPKDAWKIKRYNESPWVQWPEEMRKKTVVRHIAKWLPMDIEKMSLMAAIDRRDTAVDAEFTIEPPAPAQGTPAIEAPAEQPIEPDPMADFEAELAEREPEQEG